MTNACAPNVSWGVGAASRTEHTPERKELSTVALNIDFTDNPYSGMGGIPGMDDFPRILTYEDARSFMWNSPDTEFMFGVDGERAPVTVDLASDTPHVLVSAGSGAGKSVIARSLATQALVKGADVVFLDVKRISHRWAKNLPQTHYAASVEDIAYGLVSVAGELHRRMRVIENHPGSVEDAMRDDSRIVVVAEELNATMEALKDFERGMGRGTYKPSRAFADIMNLGRAAKVHVVGFAQYPDATIIPKRMMESFGYRLLIRHTYNMWNLLVAHSTGSNPPASQHPGRGHVVAGDKIIQTQFLYLTEEQAAELVRVAWDARQRVGLAPDYSRREIKQRERDARRALAAAER